MGFFAPVIPYIVGGLTIASGVVAAKSANDAGKAQAQQFKQEALQEGDAAREREIERKRNLLRAISSQNASAAAGGAQFSGSILAAAERDIQQSRGDSLLDSVNTGRKTRMLEASAKEARRAGRAQATTSLLSSASGAAKAFA